MGKRNLMLARDPCILAFLRPLRGIPHGRATARPIDIASGRCGRQHDLGVFDPAAVGVIEDLTEPAIVEFLSGMTRRPGRVENPKYKDAAWANTGSIQRRTVRLAHYHAAPIRTAPDHPLASAQHRATTPK